LSEKQDDLRKLLILCVDRDNDIEEKAGVKTPIVGRQNCLNAASRLALIDPEEADANSIFAAVKQYDELVKGMYECEVAVASGERYGGVKADRRLRSQLYKIIRDFSAEGLVLVSDGSEDEEVIPILQSIVPIVSVRRVVVKQSRGVEETYAVFGRYMRMLIYDPRYSRIFLGIPGLLLVSTVIVILIGQEKWALLISLGLIGVSLVVRGFDLDRRIGELRHIRPSGYIRLFSVMAGLLIIASAMYTAFVAISRTVEFVEVKEDVNLIWQHGPFLAGMFIQESLNFLWMGLGVFFAGGLLVHWMRRSVRMVRDAVGLVMLTLLYLPVLQFSQILTGTGSTATLISLLLIGFAMVFFTVTVVYMYLQSRKGG